MAHARASLYLDFGCAYVKCGVKLPDGSFRPLSIRGHSSVPAYLYSLSSDKNSDLFIGHDAKELSSTDTSSVWFYPILFLHPKPPIATWIGKLHLPFRVKYKASVQGHMVNFGSYHVSIVELLRIFLKDLRTACQDEIGTEYNLADCVIAAHAMNLIKTNLLAACSLSGFERIAFKEREPLQMVGLGHYFPVWPSTHTVIIRVGACFTSASIAEREKMIKKPHIQFEPFGGSSIDQLLMDHCLQQFETQYGLTATKPTYTNDSLHRLRLNCEAVKIQLSTARAVKLEVRQFHSGRDLCVELTVDKFKDIIGQACYQTLRKITDSILQFLKTITDYEVVLLGGTSRIPMIQDMVGWMLKKPNQRVKNVMDSVLLTGMALSPVEKYDDLQKEVQTTIRQQQPFRSH